MALNAKVPSFGWRMQPSAASSAVGEIWIYDDITAYESWWDEGAITPKKFKDDLDALGDVGLIKVYINSNGGDVFAGQAIHTMLSRHKAEVNVYIDGLAASIASVVAMAGDKVIMPSNAMMMIHNPWTMLWDWIMGNADYFRDMAEKMTKMADDLDQIRESLVAAYMKRCNCSREELIAMLDAETWLTAERCKELGLCDEVESAKLVAASLRGNMLAVNGKEFDLSRVRNRPGMEAAVARPDPSDPAEDVGPLVAAIVSRTGMTLADVTGLGIPAIHAFAKAFTVLNVGRVLSKENENHIRDAHGALAEVLEKLDKAGEDPATDPEQDPPPDPEEDPDEVKEGKKDASLVQVLAVVQEMKSEMVALRAAFSMPANPSQPTQPAADAVVLPLPDDPSGKTPAPVPPATDVVLDIVDAPSAELPIEAETLQQLVSEAVGEKLREARMRQTGRVD